MTSESPLYIYIDNYRGGLRRFFSLRHVRIIGTPRTATQHIIVLLLLLLCTRSNSSGDQGGGDDVLFSPSSAHCRRHMIFLTKITIARYVNV